MVIPIQEDPYAEIINNINTSIITINIGLILAALILKYKDERLPNIASLAAATMGLAYYNKYLFPIGMIVTCLNFGCTYELVLRLKNYRDGDLYLLRKQLFIFPPLTALEKDPLYNNDKIIHLDENIHKTLSTNEEEKQFLGALQAEQEATLKTPCKDIYEATEKAIKMYNTMTYKEKSAWRRKNNCPNKN